MNLNRRMKIVIMQYIYIYIYSPVNWTLLARSRNIHSIRGVMAVVVMAMGMAMGIGGRLKKPHSLANPFSPVRTNACAAHIQLVTNSLSGNRRFK